MSSPKKPNHRLDKLGFVLFGLALSSLMLSLSLLSDIELNIRTSFEVLLFSLILFLSYFIHSRKKPYPIIRFELFKQINVFHQYPWRIVFSHLFSVDYPSTAFIFSNQLHQSQFSRFYRLLSYH